MTDLKTNKIVEALKERIDALEKDVLTLKLHHEADKDFISDMKGHVKKFYYTVTISLVAIILWIAKTVVEKAGIGL